MRICDCDVDAYLTCPTNAYLRSITAKPTDPQFSEHRARVADFFRGQQRTALEGRLVADRFPVEAAIPDAFRQTEARLLFDCRITADRFDTSLHAVERLPCTREQPTERFIPLRHVPCTRIRKEHRVLLAFDALALEQQTGQTSEFGRLIHGVEASFSRVKFTPRLLNEAWHAIDSIIALQRTAEPPDLVLHKSCTDCEFQCRCRKTASEADDLSLIGSMTKIARQRLHQKGIFTVAQLSHTFRLRRNRKDPSALYRKRHDALTALAIREQKTHVLGKPQLDLGNNPVYLDVEGSSDPSCYYLIGICYAEYGRLVYDSYWADDHSQEKHIWEDFLRALKRLQEPTIVHYGSYETTFLKHLSKRYSEIREDSEFIELLAGNSKNVLSPIFHHFYFPVYSNGLKDIAGHLGYRWTNSEMSGAVSAIRRFEWESTGDLGIKQQLLTYNEDDCRALAHVAQTITSLCHGEPSDSVVTVTETPCVGGFGQRLSIPDFAAINRASYWEHQRNLVYVKSSPRLRVLSRRRSDKKKKAIRATRTIEPARPRSCCHCGAEHFFAVKRSSRTLFDIRFTTRGISRDVAKCVARCFRCCRCGEEVTRRPDPWPERKYGQGFLSYVVYHLVCTF